MCAAELWAICHCVVSLTDSDFNGVADREVWHVRIALYCCATFDLQDHSELMSLHCAKMGQHGAACQAQQANRLKLQISIVWFTQRFWVMQVDRLAASPSVFFRA